MRGKKRKMGWGLAAGCLLLLAVFLALRGLSPAPVLCGNDKAEIDLSRLEQGLIRAHCPGETQARLKLQITKVEGIDYNYDLNNTGEWESFSLTEGEGEYTLRVLENLRDNRYTPVFTCSLALELEEETLPFLESTQFVRFSPRGRAAAVAAEVTAGLEAREEKVQAVFDYVVTHLNYDEGKMEAVEPGYLPDVEQILEEGEGICFDYAALTAAMLRSQGIPCKMELGYVKETYHAWVRWAGEDGQWHLLDPTFVSANRGSQKVLDFVSDPENYRVKYCY